MDDLSKKKLSLDRLLSSISLSLKDTILLTTIVLTVAGSAWYYRDKIITLEEKVIALEKIKESVPTYSQNIAVLEVKMTAISEDVETLSTDFLEMSETVDNKLDKSKFRKTVNKIKESLKLIQDVTGVKLNTELE